MAAEQVGNDFAYGLQWRNSWPNELMRAVLQNAGAETDPHHKSVYIYPSVACPPSANTSVLPRPAFSEREIRNFRKLTEKG